MAGFVRSATCQPCPTPADLLLDELDEQRLLGELRAEDAGEDGDRPWTAQAMPIALNGPGKVVHFIRHDERAADADAALDAPLSASGLRAMQAGASNGPWGWLPSAASVGAQLVVASPLRRALQTATHAFGALVDARQLRPIVAVEALRERHGVHRCDQRRARDAIGAEFGDRVTVEGLTPNDELSSLLEGAREPLAEVVTRCELFVNWLLSRPEDNIAVVAHHHIILVLLHCVIQCGDDGGTYDGLLKPFAAGEIRSMRVDLPEPEVEEALVMFDPSNPTCLPCPARRTGDERNAFDLPLSLPSTRLRDDSGGAAAAAGAAAGGARAPAARGRGEGEEAEPAGPEAPAKRQRS